MTTAVGVEQCSDFFVFFRGELTLDQIASSSMRRLREDTSISPVMKATTFQLENIVEDYMRLSKLGGRIAILSSRSLYHTQSRNGLLVFIIFAFASWFNPIGLRIVPAEHYNDSVSNIEFEFSAIASQKTSFSRRYKRFRNYRWFLPAFKKYLYSRGYSRCWRTRGRTAIENIRSADNYQM